MSASGRAEMRQIVDRILAGYLRLVEEHSHGAATDSRALRVAAENFMASPELGQILAKAHHRLLEAAEQELVRQKRGDPFHRLLTHPLTGAFSDGRLSRETLVNYFSFLHLVLGDATEAMAADCAQILAEHREPDPLAFSWDGFYEDPRAKLIFWTTLSRIAESFRRFDIRRDWFIGLMQNRPQAISLGSNSFVPRHPGHMAEEAPPFGISEFNEMFGCLFGGLRALSPVDRLAFERHFRAPPERLFAPLLAALAESGAVL